MTVIQEVAGSSPARGANTLALLHGNSRFSENRADVLLTFLPGARPNGRIRFAALSVGVPTASIPLVTLFSDLEAFYQEHRRCGELESEVTDEESGWVLMWCTCGAQIARRISDYCS